MEDTANSSKRYRDDQEESPEAKRLRADLLLDILDDDTDSGDDRDPAVQDLDSVMRSFEEEIALPPPEPPAAAYPAEPGSDLDDFRQPDLGYLLEASDDELGLPPTVPCSSEEGGEAEAEAELLGSSEAEVVGGSEEEPAGFGQIWGFDDEIPYGGLDFERVAAGVEEGVMFDDALFDYPDLLCGPGDFSDAAWRPETLPAV